MATGVIGTNNQTTTTAATFIPELWSDETIAAYKSNLVVANLVTRMNHKGKKGDGINIPTPTRGSATAKGGNSKVSIQGDTHANTLISIDKHYEYSVLIEDIAEVQALSSMRKFYTDDAGFALAKQVDTSLFGVAELLNGGSQSGDWYNGGSTQGAWNKAVEFSSTGALSDYNGAAGDESDISDEAIRALILQLDNADVPMDGRSLIIPPVAANDLLGISRFTEQQFIGSGDAIKTGKIGQIYGVDVFVSSNAPTTTSGDRIGVLLHKDAIALVEQVGVRSQTQYKQEYLGDLYTADTIYGVGELRDNAGVAFAIPAA